MAGCPGEESKVASRGVKETFHNIWRRHLLCECSALVGRKVNHRSFKLMKIFMDKHPNIKCLLRKCLHRFLILVVAKSRCQLSSGVGCGPERDHWSSPLSTGAGLAPGLTLTGFSQPTAAWPRPRTDTDTFWGM